MKALCSMPQGEKKRIKRVGKAKSVVIEIREVLVTRRSDKEFLVVMEML